MRVAQIPAAGLSEEHLQVRAHMNQADGQQQQDVKADWQSGSQANRLVCRVLRQLACRGGLARQGQAGRRRQCLPSRVGNRSQHRPPLRHWPWPAEAQKHGRRLTPAQQLARSGRQQPQSNATFVACLPAPAGLAWEASLSTYASIPHLASALPQATRLNAGLAAPGFSYPERVCY